MPPQNQLFSGAIMASYSYVVTSQRSTTVNQSVVCSFTGPGAKNLILAKGNFLLVYSVHDDILELMLETPLFGRIKCLDYYRPHGHETDVLFLLTERKSFCVLGYDPATNKLVTRAVGNVRDRAGRDVEIGQRGIVDPDYRMIGMMLYEGQLKVVPMDANGMKEAFNVTLNEARIIDVKFLHGCAKPTICMLYQDNRNIRHVKTAVVDVRERDIIAGPWSQSNVEFGANLIIPVPAPLAGILLVGSSSITYIGQNAATATAAVAGGAVPLVIQSVEIAPTMITAYTCIADDGTRFLLSDHRGVLSVVVICANAAGAVTSLAIDTLGTTSIAENLAHLGDGLTFVGSIFGDSQLIKLLPERDEAGSNVQVLQTHTNIGPIRDMVLVDNDKQGGQRQLVTCSGGYKDGSLRIIRSGIGMHEQASLEVGGIKALWSLRPDEGSAFDKYLVQSFVGETRVLAIENEEMGEVEITGFRNEEATLYCGNMQGGTFVQVTARAVRLVDSASFRQLFEYTSPGAITVASGTLTQVTLAVSGGEVVYLELDATSRALAVKATARLDQDIACLSLRPVSAQADQSAMEVDNSDDAAALPVRGTVLAIAMWTDNSVRLHALPTLEEICRIQLGTDTQARDILLVEMGGKPHLFVGLGDGRLITYSVDLSGDLPSLINRRSGVLGTHPITFSVFHNAGALCVFAASDRPTVIYSKNGKVLFSVLDVNQTEFSNMAPFHSELFPNCLALSSESSLVIGVIEDIQKVHIQTVPLEQAPRRIAHSPVHSVYAVLADKTTRSNGGEETKSRVIFFDDGNLEQLGISELDPLEQGISCTTCTFDATAGSGGDAEGEAEGASSTSGSGHGNGSVARAQGPQYFVVGTAHVVAGEQEPSRGRILVFEIAENRRVHLIAEREVKGAVFSLAQVCGRLVAGIGSKVQVFNFIGGRDDPTNFTGQPELQLECSHTNQIMSLYLSVKGEHVLVGDLVRSCTLLHYKPAEKTLQEVARDFNSSYLRAIEILDGAPGEEVYVGADISGNLQCLRHVADAVSDEDRCRLEPCGEFHVGEYINAFRRGTLVGQPIDSESTAGAAGGPATAGSGHASAAGATPGAKTGAKETVGGVLSANYTTITGLKAGTCSILYGGVSGAIGNVISLSEDAYRFFSAVERVMKRAITSVGGLNHREWRSFQNDLRTASQRHMVDGDLVELILDVDRALLEGVVREINDEVNAATATLNAAAAGGLKANGTSPITTASTGSMLMSLATERIEFTIEDVLRRVEDISRLH